VRDRLSRRSWHYDHLAYESAASAARALAPLPGAPATTPWDPELAAAMRCHGVRVEEEFTIDTLLQDLAL
jgi:hypothetical protein